MGTTRYHKIDGWRGYSIPGLAVAGASDTGTWPDSPSPSPLVEAEIERFRKDLRAAGIRSRVRFGTSSNVFCAKRWVCVANADFERAEAFATAWLAEHDRDTEFIHGAK